MNSVNTASLINAIRPAHHSRDAPELDYPHLAEIISSFYPQEYKQLESLWARIDQSDDEGLHESVINSEHLLLIAQKIQSAASDKERSLWTKRFSGASIAMYGRPDLAVVAGIAAKELEYFCSVYTSANDALLPHIEPLVKTYEPLLRQGGRATTLPEEVYDKVLVEVGHYFSEEYEDALQCFNTCPEEVIPIDKVKERFDQAIRILAKKEPAWNEWSTEWFDGASFMVDQLRKKVQIGRFLKSVSRQRVKGLFAHEVLVHAQRAVNGHKVSALLQEGLDDQQHAEEGLGIVAETALNGAVPARIKDRYIDIALALGSDDSEPMQRQELFELAYSRALVRKTASNQVIDEELLGQVVWAHVNRIYKGTLGNHFVGVFTKDIVYYEGFYRMANYIKHRLEWGSRTEDVFSYLLQGKFDPTDPHHVQYLDQEANIVL